MIKNAKTDGKFSLQMCVRVPCASGRAGSEILHRFPWLRVARTGSHSCICPESPCYLSMSHTGPATRLALPLLLYNSTAPKRSSSPSSVFLSCGCTTVGRWSKMGCQWMSSVRGERVCSCLRMPPVLLPRPVCGVNRRSAGSGSKCSLRRQAAEWLQSGGVSLDTLCRPTNQRRPSGGRLGNGGRMERPVLMNC